MWWERQYSSLRRHSLYRPDFERVFQEARGLMTPPPAVFGHRGGVEVITDGDSTFAVIDWRDGGATWPHADLGQFLFGVKAWKGGWHDDLMPALMDGCLGGRPLEAETAHDLYTWEAYQALLIALYPEGPGRGEMDTLTGRDRRSRSLGGEGARYLMVRLNARQDEHEKAALRMI